MGVLTEIETRAREIVDIIEREQANEATPAWPQNQISVKVAQELVEHEAIVTEMYLDSKGIPTWGVGVTSRSGHRVERYRDNPQSIERVIEIFVWLLKTTYVPEVEAEFEGFELTEAQFAAALSFHWNTGGIAQASWCDAWKAGRVEEARERFMLWNKPSEIIERRQKECDLFFDGVWSQDGLARIIPVRKPSYKPDFRRATLVDIRDELRKALT